MGQSMGERVAALEERVKAKEIEMRDHKLVTEKLEHKIDEIAEGVATLVASENQRVGAMKLGQFIAGSGVFGAIGVGAMAIWGAFKGGGG
jgi:hypothetical protein